MNILDTHLKDMKVKGEKERVVNGITIEIYEPSEKEKFLSIGHGLEMRRVMEEERKRKLSYVKALELREARERIVKSWKKLYSPEANIVTGKQNTSKPNQDEQQYRAHVQERASEEFDETDLPF